MKFIVAFAIIFLVSHCSCENKFIQLEYSNIFANCSTRIFNNLLFLFSSGKFEIIYYSKIKHNVLLMKMWEMIQPQIAGLY